MTRSKSVSIRLEEILDAEAVRLVHEEAFPTRAEAQLVDALRATGRLSVALVAVADGAIVGHVAFSQVDVQGAADGVGLAPVGVRPAFQGQGIGAGLIRAGLDACHRRGFGFVVVLGDPAYYARFGFSPAAGWGLHDEYGGGSAFQATELRPGAIPRNAGSVRYAPEFAQLEAHVSRARRAARSPRKLR